MKPSFSPFSTTARLRSRHLIAGLHLILAITVLAPLSALSAAERESLKVLCVGNSFSRDAIADLPGLAKADGKTLVISNAYIGGCSLERHVRHLKQAEAGDPAGKAYKGNIDPKTGKTADLSLVDFLTARPWDIVTIQQASPLSFKPETYQPFADELIAAIHKYAPTAEIVVHETWAYREDHPFFQTNDGFTPAKMYSGLRDAYRSFADGKGFRVLPVGDAMNLARKTTRWTYVPDPSFDFKNPPEGKLPDQRTSLNAGWRLTKGKSGKSALSLDAIHCNAAGRYLGSAVWYQMLFNADAAPSGYKPEGLSAEDAADLRAHAAAAVQAERAREAALVAIKN